MIKAPVLLASLMAIAPAVAAAVDCLDTDAALDYWRPIREEAATTDEPADRFALQLVACLASSNSELRDQTGYELFTFWLRSAKLGDGTRRELLQLLGDELRRLPATVPDDSVYARSFSALILAELMRSDALDPFMSTDERQQLLNDATAALRRENDFRGLLPDHGWVHPLAHQADLLWRFALHPGTTATQALEVMAAVHDKVAPATTSYAFNESDRLARVISTIILRELVDSDRMTDWLTDFEKPQSMATWPEAFQSTRGMAELHNTKAFLRALSDQLDGADVAPEIAQALRELVQAFTQLI